MASDRAPTMASRIHPSTPTGGHALRAISAPANANGSANTVCWNRTSPRSAGTTCAPVARRDADVEVDIRPDPMPWAPKCPHTAHSGR